MWPYSAEENEWLCPLRLKPASLPSPDHGDIGTGWPEMAADALPAGTGAAAGDLAASPRQQHPQH